MHRLVLALATAAAFALVPGLAGGSDAPQSADRQWTIGLSSNRQSRDAEIYSVRADGTGARRLTHSPYFDGLPVWSPSRKQIAFYSQRSPKGDVWVMNPDGRNPRNLTRSAAHDSLGSWSPDGSKIVFDSDRSGAGIYVMNANGSGQRLLRPRDSLVDGYPQWSPDGKTILFQTARDGDNEIHAMDANGGNPRTLTQNPLRDGEGGVLWSPDGSRIAFATVRDGNSEIYLMKADGGEQQRLTRSPQDESLLSWSPDGRRIAFQRYPSSPRWLFYVMNADGTGVRKVTWAAPRRQ
jgi:Tol biopolymer transport system component